jgi:hypothetical protein
MISPALMALISILAQVLAGLVPQLNLSSLEKGMVTLVEEILTQLPTLWAALKSGGTKTAEVTAALISIQTVAKEAAQNTSLNPVALAWVESIDNAAQKALVADTAAQVKVDPDSLTDIPAVG